MKLHWPDLTFGPINLLNCPYLDLWKEGVETQQCEKLTGAGGLIACIRVDRRVSRIFSMNKGCRNADDN
jgi:hypothetical protein